MPVPSGPGATLLVELTGGEVITTFRGGCARGEGGVGQYTGQTAITGHVNLAGTIEIEIPIVGSESFGPFEVAVPRAALLPTAGP